MVLSPPDGLNDYAYLKYVFAQLPVADTEEAIHVLLPWNVDWDAVDTQLVKPK